MTNTIQQDCLVQFAKMVAEIEDSYEMTSKLKESSVKRERVMGWALDGWTTLICSGKSVEELSQMVLDLLEVDNG